MKYTVVLVRPAVMGPLSGIDTEIDIDTYVATTSAASVKDAVEAGQKQVFRADKKDWANVMPPEIKPEDYKMVLVFEGHHLPAAFGWQRL
jgi:hypothetical protein